MLLEYLKKQKEKFTLNDLRLTEAHLLPKSDTIKKQYLSFIGFIFDKLSIDHKKVNIRVVKIKSGGKRGYVDLVKSSSKKVIINIDSTFSLNSTVSTIAHECVHAKQILSGDLKYNDIHIIWKGKNYISLKDFKVIMKNMKSKSVKKSDDAFNTYVNFPWEKPAWAIQETIFVEYKKSNYYKDFYNSLNDIYQSIYDKPL